MQTSACRHLFNVTFLCNLLQDMQVIISITWISLFWSFLGFFFLPELFLLVGMLPPPRPRSREISPCQFQLACLYFLHMENLNLMTLVLRINAHKNI